MIGPSENHWDFSDNLEYPVFYFPEHVFFCNLTKSADLVNSEVIVVQALVQTADRGVRYFEFQA